MNAIFSLHGHSSRVDDLRIASFPLVIGRSPDADISLCDRWVSRRHCLVEEQDGRLIVRDLGSKHGTFVNDSLVSESTLLPGDRLSVGLTTLVARYDLSDSAPAAARPAAAYNVTVD